MATAVPAEPASEKLDQLCINTIRTLSMDAVQKANSGHPGTPMAMAPVIYSLWQRFLRFDPDDPIWPNRDRFVLSIGHASMLLYSTLHLTGMKSVNSGNTSSSARSALRSTTSAPSGSSTASAPATPNTAGPPASRPPPGRSAKAWRPASAWRSRRAGWELTSTSPAST